VIVVAVVMCSSLQNSEFGLLIGRNAVYSELKSKACAPAQSGVSVQSADGFIVEQYSTVTAVLYSRNSLLFVVLTRIEMNHLMAFLWQIAHHLFVGYLLNGAKHLT